MFNKLAYMYSKDYVCIVIQPQEVSQRNKKV